MFGYITVDKETISPKDYAIFNAFYCGLCFALKKRYGNKSRIFNNFDSTFAFILMASYESCSALYTKKNCIIHPFKKIPMLQLDDFDKMNLKSGDIEKIEKISSLANSVADITMLLVKGKMLDDIFDRENGAKLKMKLFNKAFNFATSQMPEFEKIVVTNTLKIAELEKTNADIDELAFYNGEILGAIPLNILGVEKDKALYELFFQLGKWVYYIDAVCDLEVDYKTKSFNPFIAKYGGYTTRQEFVSTHKFEILKYLNSCLTNIQESYEKIKSNVPNSLIENVLFSALDKQQKAILTNPNKKLTM